MRLERKPLYVPLKNQYIRYVITYLVLLWRFLCCENLEKYSHQTCQMYKIHCNTFCDLQIKPEAKN